MVNKFIKDDSLIAVVGLGDIDANRIDSLIEGVDETLEVSRDELAASHRLKLSSDIELLREAKVFIVAVPTPIDEHKKPNLEPLVTASRMVGKLIKKDDIVVYESTVFPGATEEICVPILEGVSGLKFNCQFFCGYSPERINPGDKKRDIMHQSGSGFTHRSRKAALLTLQRKRCLKFEMKPKSTKFWRLRRPNGISCLLNLD